MLGDPTTPLFSITDFISLEPYQVRAFDTSATSWRSSTSLGSSLLRNTLLFVMPADVRFCDPPKSPITYRHALRMPSASADWPATRAPLDAIGWQNVERFPQPAFQRRL